MKSRGFTLVELMVVLSITAILVGLAAPSFKSMIQSNAMSSAVNSFLADTRLARSEAVKRGTTVVMCRSNSPEASAPDCSSGAGSGGNGWITGWIVFVDDNHNGARDKSETVLRVQPPITSVNSIVGKASSDYSFTFFGNGRVDLGSTATLQFGSSPKFSNDQQRMVCMSQGGRARVAGDGTATCAGG